MLLHDDRLAQLCARRSSGVAGDVENIERLQAERVRSKRVKYWQMLGRITWKLVVLARALSRLLELGLVVIKWLRD